MMQHGGESAEIAAQIQTLGLEYHLVTKYTSFVAVDRERVAEVAGETVPVPNEPVDGTRAPPSYHASAPATVKPPRHEENGAYAYRPVVEPTGRPPPPRTAYYQTPSEAKEPKGGDDDEFRKTFAPDAPKADPEPAKKNSKTVWIPPAPAQGGAVVETLSQSDIFETVKANIDAIKRCIADQKAKDPSLHGRITMRWTILTNGKVAKVEVMTDEFKNTPLATCLSALIKTWQFPKHKTQGDPVVFPFTF